MTPEPTELCPHVESGSATMTGGWVFDAEVPPRAVGMCHECIEWRKVNLSAATPWDRYVKQQREDDERVLSADILI